MSNIQISLLVGLPGAGKTTLCKSLMCSSQSPLNSLNYIHVCFDEVIPLTEQERYVNNAKRFDVLERDTNYSLNDKSSMVNVERFKDARSKVLGRVEQVMTFLIKNSGERDSILRYADDLMLNVSLTACLDTKSQFVILIDDNLYYRSMRREYYGLAAKYRTCFSEICIDVSLCEAVEVNKTRPADEAVAEETVKAMSEKMEAPDPKKHSWEKHCVILRRPPRCSSHGKMKEGNTEDATVELNATSNLFDGDGKKVLHELFSRSFLEPVLDRECFERQELEACRSRLVTASSLSHTADLALRDLVKRYVTSGSLPGNSDCEAHEEDSYKEKFPACGQAIKSEATDKKTIARIANAARQTLLGKIKSGLLIMPRIDMTDEELRSFIVMHFSQEIEAIK